MKLKYILLGAVAALLAACATEQPEELVIIHTNDTHSNIDPDPASDLGGIVRRQVLFDSIRAEHPAVMAIDAGDIVQGTLYFHLYKGEVEQQMLNALGYDIQILGNHEFDNGIPGLKNMLAQAKTNLLSTNYQFEDSLLRARFAPYYIKKVGKKKVGFIAINLNPAGMIAEGNYDGVTFLPWQETAQQTIDHLRNQEKVDYVIAVTHIGYAGSDENPELFGDRQLAAQTTGLNAIIGGHSHTLLDPAVKVANAVGDSVLIVQTGKYGRNIGELKLNLLTGEVSEKIIPVDSRLDSRRSPELMAKLEPYRAGIDSLYNVEIFTLDGTEELNGHSPRMQQLTADFILARGRELAPDVTASIGNKGSLRTTWKPGPVTEGAVLDMMPFRNKIVVLDISGSDLIEALKVMDSRGGDIATGMPRTIDPAKTYRIATIDYLANGGDYMTPLTRGKRIAESQNIVYDDLLNYLKNVYQHN